MTNQTYYVYILQDSTKKLYQKDKYNLKFKPFYVGKGKGNRSQVHEYNAVTHNNSHNTSLLSEILKIRSKGGEVIVTKVFFDEDEELVYNKEKDVILYYGLKHKDGLLVNAGTGKAGGWGGNLNPTFDRMDIGTHNFLQNNPQVKSPKVRKLTKMIKEVDKEVDILKNNWYKKAQYSNNKSLRIGIMRILLRDKLPYTLIKNTLVKNDSNT